MGKDYLLESIELSSFIAVSLLIIIIILRGVL